KHLLSKGTLFKGGKDSIGKELAYELSDDIVLNKAVVSQIHSQQMLHPSAVLQASPVAASDDGAGTPIQSGDQSWFTFGDARKAKAANSGFAIASNLLLMKEGERRVSIIVSYDKQVLKSISPRVSINCFRAEITGAKGWHKIEDVRLNVRKQFTGQQLNFSFTLSPDDPAIVPFSADVHKENFSVDLPMVKFYLKQGVAGGIPYGSLDSTKINSVTVRVAVDGLKDLTLSNDFGTLEASKPFKPFGDFPARDASFYIGSHEIVQKQLDRIEFNLSWKDEPEAESSGTDYFGKVYYLRQSKWDDEYTLVNNSIDFNDINAFTKTPINLDADEQLQQQTKEGFFKIRLNTNRHSLSNHMELIRDQMDRFSIVKTDDTTYDLNIPTAPPVPVEIMLDHFSVNYIASSTITFAEPSLPTEHQFFHLGPFGHRRVHNLLTDEANNREPIELLTLVPQIIYDGSLFVGFENATAGLILNVLFQLADGSSNPLKRMQPLEWHYLSANNNWRRFEKQHIIDRTFNFTESGIVTIAIPSDASTNSTIVANGMIWIRVSVDENCDAVCKVIKIAAQAAKVVLVQDETRNIEFRNSLPGKAISKFVISDPAIKKAEQPFDSFGGRTKETDDKFYLRVSERLRHKQRAITMWDYEHILLEEFPTIFKVRCLNHAGFYSKNNQEHFCEHFPGHVTIVTIPDLKNKANINALRPYTAVGLLESIQRYLEKVTSPFVKLHVRNPVFEEIQLDFEVKFHENLDQSFYLQLLNQEIERFLCPWAFDGQNEISFGGKIRKSAILNFVEERPYVDYVTCFQMNHVIERIGTVHTKQLLNIEIAEGSTSRSILVSYYNEETTTRHLIKSPANCEC
ncbi:MAG: hypothetical protein H7Y31_05765, partial [Chitinophagaceae bacterium]|nr:hypothetical protein [Chitinophagaceae bacterium]